jgi:hypothetical protein
VLGCLTCVGIKTALANDGPFAGWELIDVLDSVLRSLACEVIYTSVPHERETVPARRAAGLLIGSS